MGGLPSYQTLQNFIEKILHLTNKLNLQTTWQYLKIDAEWKYNDINHRKYVDLKLKLLLTLISGNLLNVIHEKNIL